MESWVDYSLLLLSVFHREVRVLHIAEFVMLWVTVVDLVKMSGAKQHGYTLTTKKSGSTFLVSLFSAITVGTTSILHAKVRCFHNE